MARSDDYITEVRNATRKVWDGIHELVTLQGESTALDYTNSLPDGSGANDGITRAEVTAVVFTTADAFKTALDSGHGTNLAKLL